MEGLLPGFLPLPPEADAVEQLVGEEVRKTQDQPLEAQMGWSKSGPAWIQQGHAGLSNMPRF